MILHPEAQKKAQEEIDRVVGRDRLPSFRDYEHLPYVRAMVKEVMRWRGVAPLGEFLFHTSLDLGYSLIYQVFLIDCARTTITKGTSCRRTHCASSTFGISTMTQTSMVPTPMNSAQIDISTKTGGCYLPLLIPRRKATSRTDLDEGKFIYLTHIFNSIDGWLGSVLGDMSPTIACSLKSRPCSGDSTFYRVKTKTALSSYRTIWIAITRVLLCEFRPCARVLGTYAYIQWSCEFPVQGLSQISGGGVCHSAVNGDAWPT